MLWVIDQHINAGGVRVDADLIQGALSIDEEITTELTDRARAITGLDNPNSIPQLKQGWKSTRERPLTHLIKRIYSKLLTSVATLLLLSGTKRYVKSLVKRA